MIFNKEIFLKLLNICASDLSGYGSQHAFSVRLKIWGRRFSFLFSRIRIKLAWLLIYIKSLRRNQKARIQFDGELGRKAWGKPIIIPEQWLRRTLAGAGTRAWIRVCLVLEVSSEVLNSQWCLARNYVSGGAWVAEQVRACTLVPRAVERKIATRVQNGGKMHAGVSEARGVRGAWCV